MYLLMVIVPVAIGICNFAASFLLRKVTSVRAPYRDGVLHIASWLGFLWIITCVCWFVSAIPFFYWLALDNLNDELPYGVESTADVLFKNGFGNLLWLAIILVLDIGVVFGLRREPKEKD